MASERSKRMIHTAGCIIIGDEVLGGKVSAIITSAASAFFILRITICTCIETLNPC